MLDIVRSDVQIALCEHSLLAVGRLHQTLTQFTEMGSGLGGFANIPMEFQSAIHAFVLAKLQASPTEPLINTLLELVRMQLLLLNNVFHYSSGFSRD
jgi:hypothetical protein